MGVEIVEYQVTVTGDTTADVVSVGVQGPSGPGVATGGTSGQVLKKQSADDYDAAWSTMTKSDVGLSNVDNTADASKPVSAAQQTYTDTQVATKPSLGSTVPVAASPTAPSAGAGSTAAKSDHVHPRYQFEPQDHNYLAWNFDPVANSGTTALPTAGTLYVIKVHVPIAITVTNIVMYLQTLGNTLTSGQCFAALYQGDNDTLLGTTSNQSTNWATPASTGLKTMAISGGAVAVVAGDVYVAVWFNGTTGPAFARGNGMGGIVNAGLAATAPRFGQADTGNTTAGPGTLGNIISSSNAYWVALS